MELAATRIIITPLLVRWYGVLNARFPGTAMKMVVRRMAADQLIWAPIFMSVFFPVVNMTRGMSPKEALAETSQRIVPALKVRPAPQRAPPQSQIVTSPSRMASVCRLEPGVTPQAG